MLEWISNLTGSFVTVGLDRDRDRGGEGEVGIWGHRRWDDPSEN